MIEKERDFIAHDCIIRFAENDADTHTHTHQQWRITFHADLGKTVGIAVTSVFETRGEYFE